MLRKITRVKAPSAAPTHPAHPQPDLYSASGAPQLSCLLTHIALNAMALYGGRRGGTLADGTRDEDLWALRPLDQLLEILQVAASSPRAPLPPPRSEPPHNRAQSPGPVRHNADRPTFHCCVSYTFPALLVISLRSPTMTPCRLARRKVFADKRLPAALSQLAGPANSRRDRHASLAAGVFSQLRATMDGSQSKI